MLPLGPFYAIQSHVPIDASVDGTETLSERCARP
jgi:hypothetical protein